jgi:PrtD family type I secretion system ABC transporter
MTDLRTNLERLLKRVIGFSLLINLLGLAPALFSLQVFDRVLTSQSRDTLLVLVAGLAVAFALTGVLDYLRGRFQSVMGNLVNDALAPEVTRLTLAEAAKRQGPLNTEALRDVNRLRNLFATPALVAVLDAPWALIYLGVIALAHPWLGLAATASAALMLGLAVLNDRLSRRSIEAVQAEAGQQQRYLEQALHNAEVAQVLGMGGALVRRWKLMSGRLAALQGPAGRRALAMGTLTRTLRQAVQVLLQALGAYLVLTGEATPGVLIASTMLLGRALLPIEQIVASWKSLAEGRLAHARLRPALAEAPEAAAPMDLPAPQGQLSAQQVVYRPAGSDRLILAGVTLHLEPGESVAILGPSGAGKSTFARILTGLWRPTSGVVRLDGVDLARWEREAVGPHIGYVPQDVELFAGTVAENIARLGPVVSSEVVAAAKLGGVHELILGLPEGYDTVIDPHAALLSPGQRQRIALARALYGRPQLLILDEPNANLDGIGEMALADTLRQLRGQATVVLVTHRTVLTSHVDKIMVIEAGRVTRFGPSADVMQALRGERPAAPAATATATADALGAATAAVVAATQAATPADASQDTVPTAAAPAAATGVTA